MLKTLVALIGFLLASAVPARADLYYVATATFTPGVVGSQVLAFQNTSSSQRVEVVRIDLSNAQDGAAITGGLMQFWIYASTAMTHGGTTQTKNQALVSANASAPSAISISTGPVRVTYENSSATSGALPILRPLIVNDDEAATTNFADSWTALENAPINLPAGANRGLIFEQRNLNATLVAAGVLQARIVYLLK